MSIINNGLLLAAEAAAAGGYQISRSLRFNSADSAYLNRTPASAGNRKTWTWSGWVKRSKLGVQQFIFGATSDSYNLNYGLLLFTTADKLVLEDYAGSVRTSIRTTAVFRDSSAWYHIVAVMDTANATASNRAKIYVNGVEQALDSTTYATQNTDLFINSTNTHHIGFLSYLDGLLADVYLLDGTATTPSTFAETDAVTGQWVPKTPTGISYGTNGFRLTFSDNSGTTSTTLGKDAAGSNNWTPNNFSVAAGSGNDSLVDVPTASGTDTGAGGEVRGNYCTWNPLKTLGGTFSNGNLDVSTASATYGAGTGTLGVSSGKWYWEVTPTGGSARPQIGICKDSDAPTNNGIGGSAGAYIYESDQFKANNGSFTAYGASFTTNDVIGVALDLDAGTITFYKNGSSQGQAFSGLSGTFFPVVSEPDAGSSLTASANFGQRPFAYTAPSGFKALCDTNLPAPTIAKPSTVMDVVLYTGTGSSLTPTSTLGFNPDLIWIKSRSAATDHALYDAVRGAQARLESNTTDAEVTSDGGVTAFNSAGFTVGTLAQVNTSSATYAAWTWDAGTSTVTNTQGSITSQVRANASAGFSIVTYTGVGSTSSTIGHGLGVAPSFIITKARTTASQVNSWRCYHRTLGSTQYIELSSTTAANTFTDWANTSPTSTLFYVGGTNTTFPANESGINYVAYCFASVAGYSSFGSYTGNGSADGPFVFCGFRPRWILIKSATETAGWMIYDTARDTYNQAITLLYPNLSLAEQSSSNYAYDIVSNGFKVRNSGQNNTSSQTYIYAAFAESPFQYARAR